MVSGLGAKPFQSKPFEATWLVGQKAVQLAATGSASEPGVRVVVVHVVEEKK